MFVIWLAVVFLILLFIGYKICFCPRAPSNIRCDWQDAKVIINWNLSAGADTYQIFYRRKNGQTIPSCIVTDRWTNTYSLSIENGFVYEIYLLATNSFGTSFLSNTISGCSRAPAPTHLTVSHTPDRSNAIILQWATVMNCNGYVVKRRTSLGSCILTNVVQLTDSSTSIFEDTQFSFGIEYHYKVVSTDASGESGASSLVSVCPRAPPPTNLIASYDEDAGDFIRLRWKPVLNCERYVIKRRKALLMDETTCIGYIHDSSVNTIEDTSFVYGVTYYYAVISLDQAGEGGRSNPICVCPRAPAPTNLVASYDENIEGAIILYWNPTPNCKHCIVKQLRSSVRGMVLIKETVVDYSETRMYDTSFTCGMTYYYVVVSVDQAGESKRSNQIKICPRATSPKNVTVTYSQNNCTSIILRWEPVVNCEGYVVKRTTNTANGEFVTIKQLNCPSIRETDDTSFRFGVVYFYRVVSLDRIGAAGESNPISVCPRVPAPEGLIASVDEQGGSSINLSWKSIVNCECYIVQRAESSAFGLYSTIKTVNCSSVTNVTDDTFTFGITYYYVVLSFDQAGESGQSASVSICPRAPSPIDVVASLANRSSYFILLQWEPLTRGKGYIVKRASEYSEDELLTIAILNDPSITRLEDPHITFGIAYHYTVTTLDQVGESDQSAQVSIYPRAPPPENLTATTPSDASGTIILNWTSMAACQGYYIYRARTRDMAMKSITAIIPDATASSYVDSGLQNDVDYWYAIASIDAAGTSSYSEVLAARAVLLAPTNVCAVVLHSQNIVLLEWTGVSAATGYRIDRKNHLDCFKTVGYIHDASVTKFVDTRNVLADTQYSYTIYAFDDTSESLPSSDPVTATLLRSKQRQNHIGPLDIRVGDLLTETVDAVVVCSTSNELMQKILHASGLTAKDVNTDHCITKAAGRLPCKKLIFSPWTPDQTTEQQMQESVRRFVSATMQRAAQAGCNTLAFPAIGCGGFNCGVKTVAEAMISEVYNQLRDDTSARKRVSFIVEDKKQTIYDTFNQCLKLREYFSASQLRNDGLPFYWEAKNNKYPLRIDIVASSEEYQTIRHYFELSMLGSNIGNVVRIQRIQNERWYQQYSIEKRHFDDTLQQDTQRILYHGCSNDEKIVESIVEHAFDRSRAGRAHGTWYGHGVYFASSASESHRYAKPNKMTGECIMFVCSVLTGKLIQGTPKTRFCPKGYHSTTDGSSIYVVYRDAQVYAGYLIYYN